MITKEKYNFDHLSDLDLVLLQHELRNSQDLSDKEMLKAVLVELGERLNDH